MISNLEKEVTLRFLKTRKKDGFINIISIFSFIGIALGVAVLIIVMSVMNGFRTELIDKIVTSKEFREDLAEQEYNFVKKIGDPNLIANEWEKLFSKVMDMKRTHKRSKFKLKINLYYFILINISN